MMISPEPEQDPFEALGLGPDLYDYRDPYRQYLLGPSASSASRLRQQYATAAHAIAGADFLLIGAGAGMGVDSGLAAYTDVAAVPAWASRGHDYGSLCRPSLMDEDPALFFGFWGHCYNRYVDAEPHEGYAILRRWCTDVLPIDRVGNSESDIGHAAALGNHWVYTSNVDGHFHRSGFAKELVLELHGSCAGERGWFCRACAGAHPADDIAKADAGSSHNLVAVAPPAGYRFGVDPQSMTLPDDGAVGSSGSGFEAGWPRCTRAGCCEFLRPAVHMFSEDSSALLEALRKEEERYVAWECQMEHRVRARNSIGQCGANLLGQECARSLVQGGEKAASRGARVVLLELGCGLTVPSVRMEMECVLRDILATLPPSQSAASAMSNSSIQALSTPADGRKGEAEQDGESAQVDLEWSHWRGEKILGLDTEYSSSDSSGDAGCSDDNAHAEKLAGEVVLIRVNPTFPQAPGMERHAVSIQAGGLAALRGIDKAMQEQQEQQHSSRSGRSGSREKNK